MINNANLQPIENRRVSEMNLKAPTNRKSKFNHAPKFTGWISSDEDEIKRRQWRGRTEIDQVHVVDNTGKPFCDYRVVSSSGSSYTVELRSLTERINTCSCNDYMINQLGTCKHIEGVLHFLKEKQGSRRSLPSSDRIEIYVDERDHRKIVVTFPNDVAVSTSPLATRVHELFQNLRRGTRTALIELHKLAKSNSDRLRVSHQLEARVEAKLAVRRKQQARKRFEADLETGKESLDILKYPLLPYQRDGVLHLAFSERALLADDMGLGKTYQAIAACALLHKVRGINRVLVVSPASLKTEWEDQIKKFSDLSVNPVFGNRIARRKEYAKHTFFTLCNYEQILADGPEIQDVLKPEIIILDEAQRIKNWRTKTAAAVKKLQSRYAFVLTGTPLENRIDEVYSIVQFLDPDLMGPLFRFNREFYELDERGIAVGYKNLDRLVQRISSVMIRRRKENVEQDLPDRTTKTYFVPMTEEQRNIHADYSIIVARLINISSRRPLTPDEMDRLQRSLACMRMVCDTPQILDPGTAYECPKLDELKSVISELLEDPNRKIIIFSEWVRMLELIREYAIEDEIEFAWHTGSVPQHRRRAEILRFREDAECRLFLSSESGGVGLNLQVADTVINMDLPWNPARLEQRISRAWRKHQARSVTAINLVSENTIEHRMLGLLALKRTVAEGVIDGIGDLDEIKIPSGRTAFLEQLKEVLGSSQPEDEKQESKISALDQFRNSIATRYGTALKHIFVKNDEVALIVIDHPAEESADAESFIAEQTEMQVSVIDLGTHQSMHRLAQSGMIALPSANMQEIFPTADSEIKNPDFRVERATELLELAKHKLKAATLLEGGGFADEAGVPARESVQIAVEALAILCDAPKPESPESASEFLLGEGFRKDTPDSIVGLLLGEQKAAVDAVKQFVGWVQRKL